MSTVRYTQGRLGELVPDLERAYGVGIEALGHIYAFALAESGDLDRARTVAARTPPLLRDYLYVLIATMRALTLSAIGETAESPQLYDALLPYADQIAGAATVGFVVGPVAQALGQLADAARAAGGRAAALRAGPRRRAALRERGLGRARGALPDRAARERRRVGELDLAPTPDQLGAQPGGQVGCGREFGVAPTRRPAGAGSCARRLGVGRCGLTAAASSAQRQAVGEQVEARERPAEHRRVDVGVRTPRAPVRRPRGTGRARRPRRRRAAARSTSRSATARAGRRGPTRRGATRRPRSRAARPDRRPARCCPGTRPPA